MSKECPKCGAPTQSEKQIKCNFCGIEFLSNSLENEKKIIVNSVNINSSISSNLNSADDIDAKKDFGVAILLAIFLGPLGLFYVSIKGAIILIVSEIILIPLALSSSLISIANGEILQGMALTSIFWFISILIWIPISPIMAYQSAKKSNKIYSAKMYSAQSEEVRNNIINEYSNSNETFTDLQNIRRMSLFESISICFMKFADFTGRASRSEYWWFYLFITIISWVSDAIETKIFGEAISSHKFYIFFSLIISIPFFAVMTRRLHDINKSGWNILWLFTIIGLIPLIIWLASKGSNAQNKFEKIHLLDEEKAYLQKFDVPIIISLIITFFGIYSYVDKINFEEHEAQFRSLAIDQEIQQDSNREIQNNLNKTDKTLVAKNVNSIESKSQETFSPSFDCNKASQAAEATICSNAELSKLDVQNTNLYKEAKDIDPETVKNILKISIKSKYSCKINVECIKLLYEKSISDYSEIISKKNSN